MNPLELSVVRWIIDDLKDQPALAEPLRAQLPLTTVSDREFSNGGGAFVGLIVPIDAPKLPLARLQALDGPHIASPALEHGASTILHFTPDGHMAYLEVWCHANDYPRDAHPTSFRLFRGKVNVIDYREDGSGGSGSDRGA